MNLHRFFILILSLAALLVGGLRKQFATANAESTTGTHHRALTRLADAAHSYRHLLVKAGSDADHVAVCGAGNLPVGLSDDQPAAAEDPINILLLGISPQTLRMTCATAIAGETDLYTAANGFVQAEPGTAGTYYKVGRSKSAGSYVASNVYTIEVEPCAPEKLIVLAALTSGQNATTAASDDTTSQALANALKADYNKLQADFAALAGALATNTKVKILAA